MGVLIPLLVKKVAIINRSKFIQLERSNLWFECGGASEVTGAAFKFGVHVVLFPYK